MAQSTAKFVTLGIFIFLLILAFLIIKPFISAILTALVLAYIFRPLYLRLNKLTKLPTVSAMVVSILVVLVLFTLSIIVLQITAKQIIDFYAYTQSADIIAPLRAVIAQFTDPSFSAQMSSLLDNALEKATSFIINSISTLIVDLPFILLQLVITFFVMFYFIKEGETIVTYLKNLLPFEDSIKEKFFKRFSEITSGVIYGTIFVGLIQGVTAGIGFFLFGVDGAFLLMIMAIILSILPIGPWVIWLPVGISMILRGNTNTGIGLLVFGFIIVSYIDNIVRPYFVGKKIKLNLVIVLLGMLGGVSLFGIIGVIVGPIILDYLMIFFEFYRTGHLSSMFKKE